MADGGAGQPADHSAPAKAHVRAQRVDKWAHRRGEPRVFALLWAVYLFSAALLTVFSVRFIGMQQADMFRPATRALLAIAAVGVTILWPMVRLSQVAPARPLRATLSDVVALLLPLQAIIWPTKMLTGWSWSVTGGLALLLASWTVLTGALIGAGVSADGARGRCSAAGRSWWMLMCILLVGAVPGMMLGAGLLGVSPPRAMALASPLTAVHAMTSAPSGLSARMSPEAWVAAVAPLGAGVVAWGVLGLARRLSGSAARGAAGRLH